MKQTRTIVQLLLLALVLATGHVVMSLRSGESRGLAKRVSILPYDGSMSTITVIRDGTETVTLTNAAGWKICWPILGEVDTKKMAALSDALTLVPIDDTLSDQELLKLGRTHADFELEVPKLSLKVKAGNKEKRINFGAETPTGDGVYAEVEGENAVLVVPKKAFEAANMTLATLRRRNIFNISGEEVAAVDVRLEVGKFTRIERGSANNERFVSYMEELLGAEVKEFIWPVGGADEGTAAGMSLLAGYGLDPEAAATVTLHGVDGADRTICFGKGAGDGLVFALVFGGGAIVTVDSKLKYDLIEGESAFNDLRLFPMEAGEIGSMTIADGSGKYMLRRDKDGNWMLEAPVNAAADAKVAEELAERIVKLQASDLDSEGVTVSVASNRVPVKVSAKALFGKTEVDSLRSRDIVQIKGEDIKRLVGGGASVEYNQERKIWVVDSSGKSGKVDEVAVEKIVKALESLKAERVVKLKVSEPDYSRYGLEDPQYRLAIDLTTAGVARKNIIIGDKAQGGYYATLGSADAIFVISSKTKKILTANLVEAE